MDIAGFAPAKNRRFIIDAVDDNEAVSKTDSPKTAKTRCFLANAKTPPATARMSNAKVVAIP